MEQVSNKGDNGVTMATRAEQELDREFGPRPGVEGPGIPWRLAIGDDHKVSRRQPSLAPVAWLEKCEAFDREWKAKYA